MNPTPIRRSRDGITVTVRLTPGAKATRIAGLAAQGGGAVALKASVTAAPARGKANAALLAMLAKAWRLPKSSLSVVSGRADRHKLIAVAGDPDTLQGTLEDWMAENHG